MNSKTNSNDMLRTYGWVAAVVVILIIIALVVMNRRDATPDSANLQEQIENSPELREVVNSERNNFQSGNSKLNTNESYISWKYGDKTGRVPVKNGSMSVLGTGRIEGFTVNFDPSEVTMENGDASEVKSILGKDPASMVASLVLPNTVDDAFTVSFTITGAGKSTSLASGLFVEHLEGDAIGVRGDISIDPKTLGYENATGTLQLSPKFVFE